jgi:hypothetical protein
MNNIPTFKQYWNSHKVVYLHTLLPMVILFSAVPFIADITGWYLITVPIAILFMIGLTTIQIYNKWQIYYGPDGLLRKNK